MQSRNAIEEYYNFVKKYLNDDICKNKKTENILGFSKTESKIIKLLIQFYDPKYISVILQTSYGSVHSQICNINKKVCKKINIDARYRKEYQIIEYLKGL